MPASGIWNLILWIHYTALALWIGGISFLCLVAAPVVHHSMASKAVAGEIVGKILKRLNVIELGSCFVLISTTLTSFHFISGREKLLWDLMLGVIFMGILTVFYAYHPTPRMDSMKEKIPAFDSLSANHAAKIEFNRLHRIYVKLMSLNLVLGLMVLYGSVVALKG